MIMMINYIETKILVFFFIYTFIGIYFIFIPIMKDTYINISNQNMNIIIGLLFTFFSILAIWFWPIFWIIGLFEEYNIEGVK